MSDLAEAEVIEGQIEVYTESDGSRRCARCAVDLEGDALLVSLMGNGLFCRDTKECVAGAVKLLGDGVRSVDVSCERCHRSLRSVGFKVISRGHRLVCENDDDCWRSVEALFDGFEDIEGKDNRDGI